MAETPLRKYLAESKLTAEHFAAEHGMSPWSVRHWSRGDKTPSLDAQRDLETATDGAVTPAAWLEWSLSRPTGQEAA